VLESSVTAHWLEQGDRFWYTFENSKGRKFYIIDPVKKTRTFVFDPVKLAAPSSRDSAPRACPTTRSICPSPQSASSRTIPPSSSSFIVPKDAVIPGEKIDHIHADPDRRRQRQRPGSLSATAAGRARRPWRTRGQSQRKILAFEYELATSKLTLLDERPPRKPAWASISPDEKTIVFSAQPQPIYDGRRQLRQGAEEGRRSCHCRSAAHHTDGIEDNGYGGGRGMGGDQQQQQDSERNRPAGRHSGIIRTRAPPPANIAWSTRFEEVLHRPARFAQSGEAVGDQCARPIRRPNARNLPLRHARRRQHPISRLEVFEIATKARTILKTDGFQGPIPFKWKWNAPPRSQREQ